MDLREEFEKWIIASDIRVTSPSSAVECLDKVSNLVIKRKFSISIWQISSPSAYEPVFQKVIDSKALQIMKPKTYDQFTFVGSLYRRFLSEKPWESPSRGSVSSTIVNKPLTTYQALVDRELSPNGLVSEEKKPKQHVMDGEGKSPTQSELARSQAKQRLYLFRKEVTDSLLNFGFCIPKSAIEAFCSHISVDVPRGGRHSITLIIRGKAYFVSLRHYRYYKEDIEMYFVVYSQTPPVVEALRSIFASRNDLFDGSKRSRKKGYLEVAYVEPDVFELICYPEKSEGERTRYQFVSDEIDRSISQNDVDAEEKKSSQKAYAQSQLQGETGNFLFREDVNSYLLNFGITVPQSKINDFSANISVKVPLGGSYPCTLIVRGKAYAVTLSNVGFTSEDRQEMHMRYGQNSPIAYALRHLFSFSKLLIDAGQEPNGKEYIEVIPVKPDVFELICYPFDSNGERAQDQTALTEEGDGSNQRVSAEEDTIPDRRESDAGPTSQNQAAFAEVGRGLNQPVLVENDQEREAGTFTEAGEELGEPVLVKEDDGLDQTVLTVVEETSEPHLMDDGEKDTDEKIFEELETYSRNYSFKKEVDDFLLKFGFFVPSSEIETFCSYVTVELQMGGSHPITLVINGEAYSATLKSPNIYTGYEKTILVEYSRTSPIADELRRIFAFSNRLNEAGQEPKGKEYIEVVSVKPDVFELVCYSIEPKRVEKTETPIIDDPATFDVGIAPPLQEETASQSDDSNERKYEPLKQWLMENNKDSIHMSLSDIANLVGGLPIAAYRYPTFWSNTSGHPIVAAWLDAGYEATFFASLSKFVKFVKVRETSLLEVEKETTPIGSSDQITIKAALIEYSNAHKGQTKTRKEISDELTAIYGFLNPSIQPAENEIGLSNPNPKIFERLANGVYKCLGYIDGSVAPRLRPNAMRAPLDEIVRENVKSIITSRFKTGYKIKTSIFFDRFLKYYSEEYGIDFGNAQEDLDAFIETVAVVYDNRAYIYEEEAIKAVREYLEAMGSPCIYIRVFYEKYFENLDAMGIYSVDILKAFIEKYYSDVSFKRDYVCLQSGVTPSDLICKAFEVRDIWSLEELFDRLPSLNQDTIRSTLNGPDYHRTETGKYARAGNMHLPESEGEKVVSFVRETLQTRDYVAINELDLSLFKDLNPHFTTSAIQDAVYKKFLSKTCGKNRQVITPNGKKLSATTVLEQYCRDRKEVSFEELNSLGASLDPRGRTQSTCLIAAHKILVRVSADLFVEESLIHFDVERVDEVISVYCPGGFIPLKSVTDFSIFPYTGYPWNLFLLESYLRKFSRVFKYEARSVNSSNVGVIVRKSFVYNDYDDIMAIALARSFVTLEDKKEAIEYLFQNGFIARKNIEYIEKKVLLLAKRLRKAQGEKGAI